MPCRTRGWALDVFELRDRVIGEYGNHVRSSITLRDQRIDALVERELGGGFLGLLSAAGGPQ